MSPYCFSLLFFSFCTFFISILIWLKRQDLIGKFYFFFSQFAVIWAIGFAFVISPDVSYETALFCARFLNASAIFLTATWFHFTLIYTNQTQYYKKTLSLIYFLAITVNCFSYTEFFIPAMKPLMGFEHYTIPGPLFHFFPLFYFIVVPFGFAQLYIKIKESTAEESTQLKGLSIATGSAFFGGALTFLPCYGVLVPPYVLFLFPVYPFVMAYFMTREKLFDAQEIADAFQREKMAVLGTMAASLNHEIKNPLFIVRGKAECHLDALARGKYISLEELQKASESTVSPILNQAVRALDIIQKFTDFARPFNIKSPKENVILSEVFQDVRELVSSEFQRSEVKLIHNLTNGVSVMANRRHIEEILSNLIINACHAMGEKGGQVSVTAEASNKKVKIEVSDTGPGIPKENLEKVFKPFFTTKGPKGSGLGLYITKQLVERNGGKIKVDSKLGKGTTFRLELAAK